VKTGFPIPVDRCSALELYKGWEHNPMTGERELIEKLLRVEALFARKGTDGEKALSFPL
jgi:hypothetical protein